MSFSACVSHLPFATPPHFTAWTTTDHGITRNHIIDERTGQPAQFATKAEATAALNGMLKAEAKASRQKAIAR